MGIHRWDWKGPVKVAAATLGVSLILALVFGLVTKPYGSDVHWGFKSLFAWLAWGWESIFGVSATGSLDMHGSGSLGSFSGTASGSAHASLDAAPLTLTVVTFVVAAWAFRAAIRRCTNALSATLLGLRAALLIAVPLWLVSLFATLSDTDLARLGLLPTTGNTQMHLGRANVSLRWSDALGLSSLEAFLVVLLAMTGFFAALTIHRAEWFEGRVLAIGRRLLLAPLRAFGKLSIALVVAGLIFTFITVLIRWNSASELQAAPVPSLSTRNWIILAFALVAYAGNFGVAALGLGSWGQFGGNADVSWSGNIPFGFKPGNVTCSVQRGIDWWAQSEVTFRTNPCSGFHQSATADTHLPVLDWGVWTAAILAPLVLLYVASSIVKANGIDPKAKLLSLGTWLISLLGVLPLLAYLAQIILSGNADAAGTVLGANLTAAGEATGTLGLSSATPFIIAGYAGLFAAMVAIASGAIPGSSRRRASRSGAVDTEPMSSPQ